MPLVDSGFNVTYNSTLEGSMAVVLCDGFEVKGLCHRNGSWTPQLTDSVCNLASSVLTGESILAIIKMFFDTVLLLHRI